MRPWHVYAVLSLGLAACGQAEEDHSPSATVRAFLDAMGRSGWDEQARARAYRLLAKEARQRLEKRAELAGALSRREFEPWEMLPEGRYRLRFAPRQSNAMDEKLEGDRARVVVHGARGESAEVALVRESTGWKIELDVPLLRGAAVDGTATEIPGG